MKTKLVMTLVTALLPIGCGQIATDAEKAKGMYGESMTSDEQAANELYLDDVEDSAAEDEVAGTETESEDIEESVKGDMQERRLAQMVEMMMNMLDTDVSGDLTLDEFLVGPGERADDRNIDESLKAKMVEKLTADFTKYAGEDLLLTADELAILLKESAPRVGRHRHKKFPGKHKDRLKKSWEDILADYDIDGDGKLSEDEFSAIEKDRKPGHAKRRGRGPRDGRGSEGNGPAGPEGEFGSEGDE